MPYSRWWGYFTKKLCNGELPNNFRRFLNSFIEKIQKLTLTFDFPFLCTVLLNKNKEEEAIMNMNILKYLDANKKRCSRLTA